MLSAFRLNEAVSGALTGSDHSDIPAHRFYGTMQEAISDFNYEMMLETTANAELHSYSEELMIEAAMNGGETFDVLCEASIKGLKQGALNFYNKIIAMVKGIIAKLKAYIARRTGKTDRWVSLIGDKVTAGIANAKDVTVEMHNWDNEYLTSESSGMVSGVAGLITAWRKQLRTENAESRAGKANNLVHSKMSDKARERFDTLADEQREGYNKQGFIDDVAAAVKISGTTSSLEAVWAAVTKKATGGESVSQDIKGKAGAMLEAIKASSKTISALKSNYETLLKELLDHKKSLEKYQPRNDNSEGAKEDTVAAGEAQILATVKRDQQYTKEYIGAINQIKSMNMSFIDKMNMEYMKALTKVAGVKAPKEDAPEKDDKK